MKIYEGSFTNSTLASSHHKVIFRQNFWNCQEGAWAATTTKEDQKK